MPGLIHIVSTIPLTALRKETGENIVQVAFLNVLRLLFVKINTIDSCILENSCI